MLQRDLGLGAADPVREPVELEVADAVERLLAAAAAAARQHLDAGQELREGVGLRQVIVAAGAQSLDPIVDLPQRRKNERRSFDAAGAQRADQRDRKSTRLNSSHSSIS